MGRAVVNLPFATPSTLRKAKPLYALEYFEGKDKQWYWHALCIKNGLVFADGTESYSTKGNVKRALSRTQIFDQCVCVIRERI